MSTIIFCFVISLVLIAFMIEEVTIDGLISDYIGYHWNNLLGKISGSSATYKYEHLVYIGEYGSAADIANEIRNISLKLGSIIRLYGKLLRKDKISKWQWRIMHKFRVARERYRSLDRGLSSRRYDKEEITNLADSTKNSFDLRSKYEEADGIYWQLRNQE